MQNQTIENRSVPLYDFHMWIKREIKENLRKIASQRPVVLITGSRQTGKTSILCRTFPQYRYVSLDLPHVAEEAEYAGEGFLQRYPPPVIFDEIQYAPRLFRYIKHAVDQQRSNNGQYLLTGSQQFGLMQGITESLAGRIAVLQCMPLSSRELARARRKTWGRTDLLWQVATGSYPEIHASELDPYRFYADYVATYLQRDLRQISAIKNLRAFNTFMRLCAVRCSQLFSHTRLASEVGVSVSTIRSWVSALEASHLIYLLRPYHGNLGKRFVQSPKLYFCDTGLACFLAGIHSVNELQDSPLLGCMFETHVFNQIVCHLVNQGRVPQVYFYRDYQGHEVDFVVPMGNKLALLECKTASIPKMTSGLHTLTQLLDKKKSAVRAIITPQRSHRPLPDHSGVMVDNCVDLHALQ
ncbi:MAG: ATP-binding protein [Myxococcota bacterium]